MKADLSTASINAVIESMKTSIAVKKHEGAFDALRPILDTKCPFPKLDRIGKALGSWSKENPENLYPLIDRIVNYDAMGGSVVVAQALVGLLESDFEEVLERSRSYIVRGSTWYVCDIIGERTIGLALSNHFERTLPWLKRLLADNDLWVRRSAGVAIHLFVKRNKNDLKKIEVLLKFVESHIEERQVDVVKGIGWGLKTIGKHHPDLMQSFIFRQFSKKKKLSGLLLSKATTYLGKSRRVAIERHIRSL